MSDFLLKVGQKSLMGKFMSSLGVPVPPTLRRDRSPWADRPLKDEKVIVGGKGNLHPYLAEGMCSLGMDVLITDCDINEYRKSAEAYSRSVSTLNDQEEIPKTHALIYDATRFDSMDDFAYLHAFFHPIIRSIASSGRVIICGGVPQEQKSAISSAVMAGLDGFTRSVAKEVGYRGATAQLVYVHEGAEDRIPEILRFLLSDASVYMSGQTLYVSKTVRPPKSLSYAKPLEGKVALITGAARGIGEATAAEMALQGATVICLDRPEDDKLLSSVARKIHGKALMQDLGLNDAPQNICRYIQENLDGLDILVHNAGITRDKTLGKMTEKQWQDTMAVNFNAVVNITEHLLSEVFQSNGRIVCLSSIAGIAGNFGQTNYATTKAGLIGYIQGLSPTVARRGITCNAVAPGFIETRLTAAIPMMTREVGRRLSNLSQGGLPEDVAQVITWLSSPSAYGLTGNVVRVCGGNLLGA